MKKTTLFHYLFAFTLLISFAACKKEADKNDNDEIATHSDDQSQFSTEIDAVANDADIALESTPSFTGRYMGVQGIICDATVAVDGNSNPKTITITYDGTNCLGGFHTRTGVVVISMAQGVQWKNAGAAITVTFTNLKITRVRDNKSITLNGAQTYTNVSGGLLLNLATLGSITHTITSSGLSIKFDNNNTQRTWQVAKQRVFTYNNGLVITGTGLHTDGNTTGIAEWGTNRFGGAFSTQIQEPLVVRQDCNFRLTSGKVKHTTPLVTGVVTFGLNANGEPTACPGLNTYYFRVVWTGQNGNSITVIRPY
ncbi:MAG: hypothetical protein ACHQFX_18540 [Chitinophagales bacterium]